MLIQYNIRAHSFRTTLSKPKQRSGTHIQDVDLYTNAGSLRRAQISTKLSGIALARQIKELLPVRKELSVLTELDAKRYRKVRPFQNWQGTPFFGSWNTP
jgi:hypothetical protein